MSLWRLYKDINDWAFHYGTPVWVGFFSLAVHSVFIVLGLFGLFHLIDKFPLVFLGLVGVGIVVLINTVAVKYMQARKKPYWRD